MEQGSARKTRTTIMMYARVPMTAKVPGGIGAVDTPTATDPT